MEEHGIDSYGSASMCPGSVRILVDIFVNSTGLTPGSSSTVHIYTQTIHRTTQLTT